MKRVTLILVLLVAVIGTIVVALRGHDVAPEESSARATGGVATGTVGRTAPRGHRAKDETDAPPAARRIEGEVVDAKSDDPIAGADVLVARRLTPVPRGGFLDTELPGEPEFRATTAADGRFGVDVPAGGPWFVTARAADHVDAVAVAAAGDDIHVELAAGIEKTFTVRRAADRATIAGAEITVYDRDGKGPSQLRRVSDEHGEARLRVRAEDATLVVRARGCARVERQASQTDLLMVPGYRIAGVVRDRAGRAVAGAELRIEDVWEWRSDADGRFVLDEVTSGREGRQHVEVEAKSFVNWIGSLYCGDTDAVVELSHMGTVAGTVVLPDGASVANAKVGDATTDGAGAFRFQVESGTRRLWASWMPSGGKASDELFGMEECEVPDGGTIEGIVIRLNGKSFVPLRIVDASGRAVTDVRVRTGFGDDREVRGDLVLVSVEKPVGTAVNLSLSDGSAGGPRWSEIAVAATTQAAADAAPVDVRLPALREFTATVLSPSGEALAAETQPKCTLYDVESGFDRAVSVRQDASSMTWLVDPTKRYELRVEADGFPDVRRMLTPTEMAEGHVSVRLDPGVTVRGRLVAADPNAVASAALLLRAIEPRRDALSAAHEIRDADGGFRIEHVPSGAWRLVVTTFPMKFLTERPVQVAGGADVDLGDIVLPASVWVHGVVRAPDGRPVGGCAVQLRQTEVDFLFGYSVLSQDDGSFAIYVRATGRDALLVRHRGYGAAVARLDGVDLATPLDVRLAPEANLDIRIRLPHAGVHLDWYVQTPDGDARWQPSETGGPDTLGFDERHVCGGLAPGPLVVVIQDDRSVPAWKFTANVTVVAGETTTVVVGPER